MDYREENGKFTSRSQLLKVAKLGPKAFEQCAGFMRISDGKNPLDATGVHPESYDATKAVLEKLGYTMEDVKNGNVVGISKKVSDYKALADEAGVGEITLRDIVKELEKPARDPREDMPKPILRSDVLEMKDLTPGMVLKGTVRNVIDFGCFVDIGVHQDGLVHISEICDRYIKHPLEAVSVGDIVDVQVMSVDLKKQRIQLTMKSDRAQTRPVSQKTAAVAKTMLITRLTEVIEITAAGIAETIEIVQAARIITTETKSHTT